MVCIFFAKVHFLRKRGKVSILKITAPHIFFTLAHKKQNRGVHLLSLLGLYSVKIPNTFKASIQVYILCSNPVLQIQTNKLQHIFA